MGGHVNTLPFEVDTADLTGLTVIEASAGTGKTHAIQKLVARLVREGVPMPRMLVMSYTKTAAAELSQRIRQELQEALEKCPSGEPRHRLLLQQALADFDRACICTIHAFCQRMLQEHPLQAGVHGMQGWTLQTDETEARARACADAWAALVASDAGLAAQVGAFRTVTGGLKEALERRLERERVQAADFSASRLAVEGAFDQLRQADMVAALSTIAESFNKGVSGPAKAVLEEIAAGVPGGAAASACRSLQDDECVRGSIPKNAAKAAAAHAVLSGDLFRPLMARLQTLAEAVGAMAQAAIDTVVRDALRRLLAHRAATRTLVFDDLISRLRDAVLDPSGAMARALRERFDTVIVDEVQDTDPEQASILQRAFAESPSHRLILVGDPKQSIYAFRNADVDSYMALRSRCRKAWYRLDVSWRSDQRLIDGVQALYAVHEPFLRRDIPPMQVRSAYAHPRVHGPDGGPAGLVLHASETAVVDDMLDTTARAIAADLQAGWTIDDKDAEDRPLRRPMRPGDVAVLCHFHRQGRRVADALQALGVPVIVMDQERVWQSEAAAAVLRLLAAMARPTDRVRALGALAGACTGLHAEAALNRPDDWVQALRAAAEQVGRQGVGAALRQLVHGVPGGGRAAMLRQIGGERLATDFDHVVEELDKAQTAGAGTVHALADWLAQRVHGTLAGDEALCRSLGGVDAVQVMTLHGSKGLTFGVTWLPTFMVPSNRETDAAETRRLLYVGLTRARFVTHMVWMPAEKAAASPLAHLLHARSADSLDAATEAAKARLARPPDAQADLAALAAGREGAVGVMPLDPGAVAATRPRDPARLVEPRATPLIPERAVMLSFTQLSSVKRHAEGDREERDVDAVPAVPGDGPREPVTAMDQALREAGPSGAALGTLVHDALAESEAFACLAPGAHLEPLHRTLRREAKGLNARSDAALGALAAALQRALAAPTGDPGIPTVAEAAARPDRCLLELNVALPWQAAPERLSEVLRAEQAPWSDRVAQILAHGDSRERLGSLVGSIDLAVEHGGQWFIHDYKTNLVGDDAAAYAPEALHRAMAAELYPLQAALYAVMLSRWLASRGWRPTGKPVIGGVAYLFLRGMDPDTGSRGTWTWKPSQRLIAEMDAILPPACTEARK